MTNFHVGQKVECVCDEWHNPGVKCPAIAPRAGEVYTIRSIYEDPGGISGLGLLLEEILGPQHPTLTAHEMGWGIQNFRPVIDRKTDTGMAILREILDKPHVEIKEPERVR